MVILAGSDVFSLVTGFKEDEFERWIVDNVFYVFGDDVVYFDVKKQIKSIINTKTIPDGYLIRLSDPPVFMVIEYELSDHSPYRHTLPQLTKFDVAIENVETQRKLADVFYEELQKDTTLLTKIKAHLDDNEVYYFLKSVIQSEPQYLVLIDEVIDEYHELADRFPANTMVRSFKTYRNSTGDCIHEFEPIFKKILRLSSVSSDNRKKIDQRIRDMVRRFKEKGTSAWRSLPPTLRESLQIRGFELVKNRNNDEVILLAYLDSPLFKTKLVDQGYTEWFSDYNDGDWYGHTESPNSNTHSLLLRTSYDKLDLNEVKQTVYRLIKAVTE